MNASQGPPEHAPAAEPVAAPHAAPRRGPLRPLSVAPMMDRTDRHFRFFLRQLTRRTLLYSEMVTTGAVLHGDRAHLLGFDPEERPLALQLGGDDPRALAAAARIGEELGYDEINLNAGCPSDRVQQGRFGACLMKEPERVAECVAAMRAAVALPVTVKHRIGVDDLDRYEDMLAFVDRVAAAGCDRFIVHARKAWLSGLSPKENRDVPPLRHDEVYLLKRERPHLAVESNGGIHSLDGARAHLAHVDGAMIGRAACDDPWLLADADAAIFGDEAPGPTRREAIECFLPYVARRRAEGVYLSHLVHGLLGLMHGRPGARAWRRILTERAVREGAGIEVLAEAAAAVPDEVLDERPAALPPA
ncbi:MAG: TIM-barrel protein, yjbN family [Acidobacteria bacterium]|nr:TIM-barrel protein, yjbN family [Acidobacteriota bacterium]